MKKHRHPQNSYQRFYSSALRNDDLVELKANLLGYVQTLIEIDIQQKAQLKQKKRTHNYVN